METKSNILNGLAQISELAKLFDQRAAQHDEAGDFVFENYADLKANGYFSAMIPEKFGGGGISHSEMCENIKTIGKACGSTALALSMHQHLIAAAVWKYKQDKSTESMLRNVAKNELILISTGARDWLDSNGELTKISGGYLYSGKKFFASQSAIGDVIVTSGPLVHEDTRKVLHFSVPTKSQGIKVLDDWDVLGMRSTGSQTIEFDKVFIPSSAITLERLSGEFHPAWHVVLTVAMPLIMSAYVGIAERAVEIAIGISRNYARNKKHASYIIGKMFNTLLSGKVQWERMVSLANDLEFSPDTKTVTEILSLKTNVSDATIEVLNQSMDAIGGQSYYKKKTLERLFRDIHASKFHPLPKWEQYEFTGNLILS